MNHRETPHHPVRRREALGCFALMLLTPAGIGAQPRPNFFKSHAANPANPTVYLPVVGAPQLRFQPKPVVAEAPPKLAPAPMAPSAAASTSAAGDIVTPRLHGGTDHVSESAAVIAAEKTPAPTPPPPVTKSPPPIMIDDLRPAVRAEDFLPYFQMPGSSRNVGDVNVLVPVPRSAPTPAAIPPSSATYTQTPK